MSTDSYYKSISNNVVDLSLYNASNNNDGIFVITNDLDEITFTSCNKPCNVSIYVKPRTKDLKIFIKDLIIKCSKEISMNFAGSSLCNYKNILVFSGINMISNDNNIGVCITNNQTLEIHGEKDSVLKVSGGSSVPAVGNNYYTSGSGHIIFSGYGDVEITGGMGNNNSKKTSTSADISSCAICFSNTENDGYSSFTMKDYINVSVHGENGENLSSISLTNSSGKGGCAICMNSEGKINKTGSGLLLLQGGDGGDCIGSYSCGLCADGGEAIKIGYGLIDLKKPVTLISGSGGNAKNCKEDIIICKGGNGGNVISVNDNTIEHKSKISLDNHIDVLTGNGGNSGVYIINNKISPCDGGNSGNFIFSNNNTEVSVGKINIAYGKVGSGTFLTNLKGNNGTSGQPFVGSNISFTDYESVKTSVPEQKIEPEIHEQENIQNIVKDQFIAEEIPKQKTSSIKKLLRQIFYID